MYPTKKKFSWYTYQQGLQGAESRTLGHMECIRLKKFLVCQQGLQGVEFRSLGHMECIRPTKENSWYISRGCRVQNSGP